MEHDPNNEDSNKESNNEDNKESNNEDSNKESNSIAENEQECIINSNSTSSLESIPSTTTTFTPSPPSAIIKRVESSKGPSITTNSTTVMTTSSRAKSTTSTSPSFATTTKSSSTSPTATCSSATTFSENASNKANRKKSKGLRVRRACELLTTHVSLAAPTSPTWPTWSGPLTTRTKSTRHACTMWVHLQASICTEWEQTSMRLDKKTENNPTQSSLLKALTSNNNGNGRGTRNANKRPKTIHRCLLQRVAKRSAMDSASLVCHVCASSYRTYAEYLQHLIDNTCIRIKSRRRVARSNSLPSNNTINRNVATTTNNNSNEIQIDNSNNSNSSDSNEIMVERTIIKSANKGFGGCTRSLSLQNELGLIKSDDFRPSKRRKLVQSFNNNRPKLPNLIETVVINDEEESTPLNLSRNALPALIRVEKRRQIAQEVNNNTNNCSDKSTFYGLNVKNMAKIRRNVEKMPLKLANGSKKRPVAWVCVHREVLEQPQLSVLEHVGDEQRLSLLKANLTTLLISLLGEQRLTRMGYPDRDVLELLTQVLAEADASRDLSRDASRCDCDEFAPGSALHAQMRFRQLRRELNAAKSNVLTLLRVCVPDQRIWAQWSLENVEQVLDEAANRRRNV